VGLSERDHGVNTFRNGTKLSAYCNRASSQPEQTADIRDRLESNYGGTSNAGRTMVLGKDVEYSRFR